MENISYLYDYHFIFNQIKCLFQLKFCAIKACSHKILLVPGLMVMARNQDKTEEKLTEIFRTASI